MVISRKKGVLIRKGHTGDFRGNLLLLDLGFGSTGIHFIIIINQISIVYAFSVCYISNIIISKKIRLYHFLPKTFQKFPNTLRSKFKVFSTAYII